jgi:hypothetical protein
MPTGASMEFDAFIIKAEVTVEVTIVPEIDCSS